MTLGGSMGIYAEILPGVRTGQPYIEESVTIYTGASVFGPVHIRNNSIIKAGRIVTPKNSESSNIKL